MSSDFSSSPKRPTCSPQFIQVTDANGDRRITLACQLDRSADALLFLGRHDQAERLAMRAQALREVGP